MKKITWKVITMIQGEDPTEEKCRTKQQALKYMSENYKRVSRKKVQVFSLNRVENYSSECVNTKYSIHNY